MGEAELTESGGLLLDLLLYIHVAGGGLGLLAGGFAIALKKGRRSHRQAGRVFLVSMLVMASSGAVLAWHAGKPFDVLSSGMACYMVVSGWLTFSGLSKPAFLAQSGLGLICLLGYLGVEGYALLAGVRATDAPEGMGYVFATILLFALWGDARRLSGSTLHPRRRHQWRMNFGLLLATASFFGARPHLFPEWLVNSGALLVLTFAPIVIMLFWMVRLRLS